ncbi:MAG: DUF2336 domain-containing protein [Rhodospirillales bacterium]|nr:DUF2336 domain-containing protein [Rhodospirillales bacterium]
MLSWVLGNRKKKSNRKRPSYADAKRIAASGSVAERKELASHNTLEPELLYYLADDDAPEVRKEIAKNDGAPLQADQILARDPIDEVRTELAYKIARLIPTLTDTENQRLTEMALAVLEVLANDELPDVRAIVAEEIKRLENVPKHIITKLAHDAEAIVSAPILEYSPLLSELELVQIIAGGVQGAALIAVARRIGIGEAVSSAIVDQDDKPSMLELLKNQTARISEKAMQVIGMKAPDMDDMHRPLVERSNLSVHTMKRIATFVSAALVERLIEQNDLTDAVSKELRQSIRERIEAGDLKASDKPKEPPDERARKLFDAGKLDDGVVKEAIETGDITFVPPALSLLSGIEIEICKRVLMGDSGKGVVSLAWKAGLTMATAEMIERRVAQVPARSLVATPSDGEFPLTDSDMEWYLAYFDE